MITITQSKIDLLADVYWWLSGYIKGNEDALEKCLFSQKHIEAIGEIIIKLKELNDNITTHSRYEPLSIYAAFGSLTAQWNRTALRAASPPWLDKIKSF